PLSRPRLSVVGSTRRRAGSAQAYKSVAREPWRDLRRPCGGGNMGSLSNWGLHRLTHRREIRNLASAFVGEIAVILHLIETHDVVSMLEKALDASDGLVSLPNLTLPPFTIYTA